MTKAVRNVIKEHTWLRNVKLPLLGIGGTARNIAKWINESYRILLQNSITMKYHIIDSTKFSKT